MKRLGDAEYEVMEALWTAKDPVKIDYIMENLKRQNTWQRASVMTILSRLGKKGFVYCDRTTRRNLYSALIPAEKYKVAQCKKLLKNYYDDSLAQMVRAMLREKELTFEDIGKLKDLINEIGD